MIKKILILFFSLFLTGCSATYNIQISKNSVSEELVVNNKNTSSWNNKIGNMNYKEMINYNYNFPIPVLSYTPGIFENDFELQGYDYYQKQIISTTNNYGLRLNYTFKFDDYNNSTIVNNAYNNFDIKKDKNTIVINVYGNENIFVNYSLLDEIRVNVTIPFNVLYHNADNVLNNTYTWIINKENVLTKSIALKYVLEDEEIEVPGNNNVIIDDKKNENKISLKLIVIISSVFLIVGFTLFIIFRKRFNKNNDV